MAARKGNDLDLLDVSPGLATCGDGIGVGPLVESRVNAKRAGLSLGFLHVVLCPGGLPSITLTLFLRTRKCSLGKFNTFVQLGMWSGQGASRYDCG